MKNDKTAASASSAQAASKSVKSAPPLPTPEELMEQYAALVWKTAAAYLENPEDVKECVNDTFLEFYLHPDRYDPEKGSYAAFLCAIARRKAISAYRKNRKASGFSVISGGKAGSQPASGSGSAARGASAAGAADRTDPADMADPFDMADSLADRLDLKAALKSLKPEEFDIIRMKYYDGMTIKEIADSLNLSYETVKKRHQRSLTKLQKALTIGLILAAIAALAACAYVVLRYFGIVPGYGVNTNAEVPFYQLAEAELESDPADGSYLEISDARYMNSMLYVDALLFSDNPEPALGNAALSVSCGGLAPENAGISAPGSLSGSAGMAGGTTGMAGGSSDMAGSASGMSGSSSSMEGIFPGVTGIASMNADGSLTYKFEIYFPELEALLEEGETTLDAVFSIQEYGYGETVTMEDGSSYNPLVVLRSYELSYSLSLAPLAEDELESYSYSVTEDGGLLLMPRLENGELLVDIYPLDPEDGQIVPALLYCNMQNPEEQGVITAEAEDGTVLEGTCVGYNPFTSDAYFTWSFGPAEEGEYTLHVPYLLKKYSVQEDIELPFRLEEGYISDAGFQTEAGTLSAGPLKLYDLQPDEIIVSQQTPFLDYSEQDFYWLLPVTLDPAHPDEELVFASFGLSRGETPELTASVSPESAPVEMVTFQYADANVLPLMIRVRNQAGRDAQEELSGLALRMTGQPCGASSFAMTNVIYTRWNQSFSIPFTVEADAAEAADQQE